MNVWRDMPIERVTSERFPVYITTTKGSNKKYRFDLTTGMLQLAEMLYSAACHPVNGGIIPLTLCRNQEPLESLVVCQEPLELHTLVECYPVGVIKVQEQDIVDKIVALPILESTNSMGFVEAESVLKSVYKDIRYFFHTYNGPDEEDLWTGGRLSGMDAVETLENALERYRQKYIG